MKVLVIPSWYPDGEDKLMGIYHKEYASSLAKNGVDVDMLCVFRERLKYPIKYLLKKKNVVYQEDGYKVYLKRMLDLEKINLKFQMILYCRNLERLFKKYIRKNGKPDILHAQVTYPAGYATCKLGQKYDIPVLVTEHASHFTQYMENQYEPYGKYVLENATFSTVSNLMLKQLEGYESFVLPNIIDTNIFCVKKVKKRDDKLNLITVSAFRIGKGIEDLIEAINILVNQKNMKNIHLNIVGDGYLLDKYKGKAESLGLLEYITFMGRKDKTEISEILSMNDIYVIPSHYESFCITGVEALACGLPVVSTRCAGPEEYIDKKCGEFCKVKNPSSMCDAIIKVSKKLDKYDTDYIASVADRYSPKTVTNTAKEIYKKMLKK